VGKNGGHDQERPAGSHAGHRIIGREAGLAGQAGWPGWLARDIPIEGAAKPKALLPSGGPFDPSDGQDGADMTVVISHTGPKGGNLDTDGAPENWPSRGTVVFDNVWMRYSSTAPFALKGVLFTLQPQDKVGIVGRTGSGKSTCLLALYRLFELDKGAIYVDGVNVASMTLSRLRRGLSIIPQEPVIFSGTVRTNLDPFDEHTDNELHEVIREASLTEQVKRAGGLQGKLSGTGSGAWSLGQQQLVCLARAALRCVPVLCLDEATAAMDPHTEKEVQSVIQRVFNNRTIITIAHRLDTVIELDKVAVMESDVLKECAPPSELLADRNSMFSLLVDKSGEQTAAALRSMASELLLTRAASSHLRQ
jgi:ATP-binding cassette subfamily C (CFTR/MRP) protein 1